jgi:hypothetical protein
MHFARVISGVVRNIRLATMRALAIKPIRANALPISNAAHCAAVAAPRNAVASAVDAYTPG